MKARVFVTLKVGVLDPQGQAIENSLKLLVSGEGIESVRQGKVFDIDLADELTEDEARVLLSDACDKLLANTVIEEFQFEFLS